MMKLKNCWTVAEVDASTGINVEPSCVGDAARVQIGNGTSGITLMMDWDQLDRLADAIRTAQHEHDIRTGMVTVEDEAAIDLHAGPQIDKSKAPWMRP